MSCDLFNFVGRACLAVIMAVLACGLAACSRPPTATFEVHQPRMPGRQQEMTLTSSDARYGCAADKDAWQILVEFPLPGAASGRSKYVVYLHVPDPSACDSATYPLGETAVARGFFIQKAGEGRGREIFVGGFVELRRGQMGTWSVKLLADGALCTQIRGTAELKLDNLNVRDYIEAHHRGDVADLLRPAVTTQKANR